MTTEQFGGAPHTKPGHQETDAATGNGAVNLKERAPDHLTHPTTIQEFEAVYRKQYAQELESCDSWITWCKNRNDTHGINFHQGLRSAHVFNNIKMEQLLRVLKQEAPNARD